MTAQPDPFANIFGAVRLIVDKLRELEATGQAYGFSRYMKDAIILYRATEKTVIYQVFMPSFSYYFEFLIEPDPKTKVPTITDFRIVYPAPVSVSDSQLAKEMLGVIMTSQAGGQNE